MHRLITIIILLLVTTQLVSAPAPFPKVVRHNNKWLVGVWYSDDGYVKVCFLNSGEYKENWNGSHYNGEWYHGKIGDGINAKCNGISPKSRLYYKISDNKLMMTDFGIFTKE